MLSINILEANSREELEAKEQKLAQEQTGMNAGH